MIALRIMLWRISGMIGVAVLIALVLALAAHAHDDGRYANSPLKSWFDGLASERGLCCSYADGETVKNVDWDTGGPNNAYRVRLLGQWIVVPDDAVIRAPNKFGAAVVWPVYQDDDHGHHVSVSFIRCFIAGAGA